MSESDRPARRLSPISLLSFTSSWPGWARTLALAFAALIGLALAAVFSGVLLVGIALAVAYPNLPDIGGLSDYRPKLPMRIYSADGVLLGEFGEERRNYQPIAQIPKVMRDAVLAIEDARFYQHGGVDYKGVIRAGLANLGEARSQGASTITMQVARNFYLSAEKKFTRKIYEILLALKIEHQLNKDQILELYMNQIYLGQRAYGFAAASEIYFGKPLKDITVAEAAMLAGLPKGPSVYNPVVNPKRATQRQQYIIDRMVENGFITEAQADAARSERLHYRAPSDAPVHAEYVAETARQLIYSQYGDESYTRGLNVFVTINAQEQAAAYRALRRGILAYEKRQLYRGPEAYVDLPADPKEIDSRIAEALVEHPDNDELRAAVVLEAGPKMVVAVPQSGEAVTITGDGLKPATVVNDAPLFFDAGATGSQPWEPKNYDGKFEGPMPLRTALAKSKNMVSIRILQSIGAPYAQEWITRFGFDADKHPAYLTMALGAGSVTPIQMASAYAVFANGGYRIAP